MPRVYATADLHGQLPRVPDDCEVLLIAGDICPDFIKYHPGVASRFGGERPDKGEQQQRHWLDTVFREYLNDLKKRGVKVLATWGNHDFVGEHDFLIPKDLPWTLLVDEEATVEGLRVYGTPWVPGLPYWAFYGDERRLRMRAEAIPEGLDVLMTHGPPRGAGDFINTSPKQREKYGNYNGMCVGDPTLNEQLERIAPKVVICGHIHEDRGQHMLSETPAPIYNVAAVDEEYKQYERPYSRLYEF